MKNASAMRMLYLSFFLSGISALIYEILWSKHFALVLGSTAIANTLTLAIYMSGLAIGSFFLGGLSDKIGNKVTFYCLIQMGIAIFGLASVFLLMSCRNFFMFLLPSLYSKNSVFHFAACAIITLPSTILMGSTLPVISKYAVGWLPQKEKSIAGIYYINNLGAVTGVVFSGFFLIKYFGLCIPFFLAASLNILAAIAAVSIELRSPNPSFQPPGILKETNPDFTFGINIIRFSFLAMLLSGFTSFAYEVVWIRLFSQVLGASTYSFSLVLAAFISGITLGSFLISRSNIKTRSCFLLFGLCELAIVVFLSISLPFYERLPYLFYKLSGILYRSSGNFALYETVKFLLCILVMFLPALFFGMTFPLISCIATDKMRFFGKRIGSVFSFNVAGNILGALLTGFLLIPLLGLRHTLELTVLINLFIGVSVLLLDNTIGFRKRLIFIFTALVFFVSYKTFVTGWNNLFFTAQIFRGEPDRNKNATYKEFSRDLLRNRKIIYFKDGMSATVAVVERGKGLLTLYINGKADASTDIDLVTQILTAHVPLILKPSSREALIIGLGSGISCGSALLHPLESLDLVEIYPEVLEANKYFSEFNNNALLDKRLTVHVEDAKTFLQRTDKKYDVIINEPSNPWMTGVGNLFSVEFFADCAEHLKSDGIIAQWIQAYEMDDATFNVIVRTMQSVFPFISVWDIGSNNIILIGSLIKPQFDLTQSQQAMSRKEVKVNLEKVQINDFFTFLSLQMTDSDSVNEFLLETDNRFVNSDYFPLLEYKAPISLFLHSLLNESLLRLDERLIYIPDSKILLKNFLLQNQITYENLKNLYLFFINNISYYSTDLLLSLINKWHSLFPEDKDAILAYADFKHELSDPSSELKKLILNGGSAETIMLYARSIMETHEKLKSIWAPEVTIEALRELNRCIELSGGKEPLFYFWAGEILLKQRDYNSAISNFQKAKEAFVCDTSSEEDKLFYNKILLNLSYSYYNSQDMDKSLSYVQEVLSSDSNNPTAKTLIRLIIDKTSR